MAAKIVRNMKRYQLKKAGIIRKWFTGTILVGRCCINATLLWNGIYVTFLWIRLGENFDIAITSGSVSVTLHVVSFVGDEGANSNDSNWSMDGSVLRAKTLHISSPILAAKSPFFYKVRKITYPLFLVFLYLI